MRISDWSSDVCSSDLLVDRLRAAHPGLRANAAHPVGETRHEAEILDDVLFADQPHRDNATGSDGDGRTEEAFEHEDALGMVAKRTMAKVGGDRLGLVEPLVEREVFLRDPAPIGRTSGRARVCPYV